MLGNFLLLLVLGVVIASLWKSRRYARGRTFECEIPYDRAVFHAAIERHLQKTDKLKQRGPAAANKLKELQQSFNAQWKIENSLFELLEKSSVLAGSETQPVPGFSSVTIQKIASGSCDDFRNETPRRHEPTFYCLEIGGQQRASVCLIKKRHPPEMSDFDEDRLEIYDEERQCVFSSRDYGCGPVLSSFKPGPWLYPIADTLWNHWGKLRAEQEEGKSPNLPDYRHWS